MDSFKGKFARATAFAALALSAALMTGVPVSSAEEATTAAAADQRTETQAPLVIEYKGADKVSDLISEINRLSKGKPLFLMFYAEWCDHCETMTNNLKAAKDQTKLPFTVLRVPISRGKDQAQAQNVNPTLSQAFDGSRIPNTHVVLDGTRIGQFVGVMPLKDLVAAMDDLFSQMQADQNAAPAPAPAL